VETDTRWELLLGLVQVAVGYHKAVSGHPGARRMLILGLEKLAPFPDRAWGVAVDALRRRVQSDVGSVETGNEIAARLADPPRLRLVPIRSG
jgi:hypothetical protein